MKVVMVKMALHRSNDKFLLRHLLSLHRSFSNANQPCQSRRSESFSLLSLRILLSHDSSSAHVSLVGHHHLSETQTIAENDWTRVAELL